MSTEIEQYISNKKKEVKNGFISAFIAVFLGAFLIYIDWPVIGGIILVLGGLSFFWNLYIKKEATKEFYLKSKDIEKAALEVELRKKESLELFEESMVIGPNGDTWGKFMAASGTTSVDIYYSDIRSVIVQQQNVVGALFSRNISDIGKTLPYIRILIKGTESYSNGDFSPVNDPYTVTFTADKLGQAENFKIQIDNLVSKHRQSANSNSVINQISSADELEKFSNLLQKGIITQEEFDLKKKQILGL